MALLVISIIVVYSLKSCSADMTPKIVGGLDASIDDWPFIAFIGYYGWNERLASTCGGTLISSQTVLTAAHCLDDITKYKKRFYMFKNITVQFGSANRNNPTEIRSGVDYLTYPEYNTTNTHYDIGVLLLDSSVVFSDTVKKILLLNRPLNDEEPLLVAGWGAWSEPINETNQLEDNLQFLPHTYIPKNICESQMEHFKLDPGTICAGTSSPHKYAFSGDSGGPLVTLDGFQVGVVSFKLRSNGITVFTFVPDYISWIKLAQAQLYRKYCGRTMVRTAVEDGLLMGKDAPFKCDDQQIKMSPGTKF